MQAGGGGAGGFAAGYLMAQHPEAAAVGIMAVLVSVGGYYAADFADKQTFRELYAIEIIEKSLTHCANARANPALYISGLNDELMSTWSFQLDDIAETPNLIICMDDGLNDFTLPYDIKTMNDQNEFTQRNWGEHRVTGVVYQDGYGHDVLVIKPDSDIIPDTSTDLSPDRPHGLGKIYAAYAERPQDTFSMEVPNSDMSVSVIMQQDGVQQKAGYSKERDDDGVRWATPDQIDTIGQYYNFEEPV